MPQHPHPSSVRLPADLKKFLLRKAAEEDRKLGGMIIHILEEYRAACRRPAKAGKPPAKDTLTGYSGIMRDDK